MAALSQAKAIPGNSFAGARHRFSHGHAAC
jgi:hypothetical protein